MQRNLPPRRCPIHCRMRVSTDSCPPCSRGMHRIVVSRTVRHVVGPAVPGRGIGSMRAGRVRAGGVVHRVAGVPHWHSGIVGRAGMACVAHRTIHRAARVAARRHGRMLLRRWRRAARCGIVYRSAGMRCRSTRTRRGRSTLVLCRCEYWNRNHQRGKDQTSDTAGNRRVDARLHRRLLDSDSFGKHSESWHAAKVRTQSAEMVRGPGGEDFARRRSGIRIAGSSVPRRTTLSNAVPGCNRFLFSFVPRCRLR